MIVVLKRGTTPEQAAEVVAALERRGLRARLLRRGEDKALVHVIAGPTRAARRVLRMERVQALVPTSGPRVRREGRRFYPYHFMGWAAAGLALLGLLVLLAGLLPPGLGAPLDPTRPPEAMELPWYFAWPARALAGVPPWLAGALLAVLPLALLALPLVDRPRGARRRPSGAALLLAVLGLAGPAAAQAPPGPQGSSCVVCHGREGLLLRGSVHARAGVTCTSCHGGVEGPLEKGPAHGDGLRPLDRPGSVVASCGGCHADLESMRLYGLRTDQLALYHTSQHGQRLAQDPAAPVATCATCHGSHEVLGARDPRSPVHPLRQGETCGACHADAGLMARFGLDASVVGAWRASVHGRALVEEGRIASPACVGCHGSHGATPPRAEETGRVCGHCHAQVQEAFERSPHAAAARVGEIEECVSCHGDHGVPPASLALLRPAEGGLCGLCHAGDPEALAAAGRMHGALAGLQQEIDGTELLLARARAEGLVLEDAAGYLDEARALRVRGAVLAHALQPQSLEELAGRGRGMVRQTRELLAVEARVLRDRRIFSAVFLVVTLLLALLLLAYRRELRARAPASTPRGPGEAGGA